MRPSNLPSLSSLNQYIESRKKERDTNRFAFLRLNLNDKINAAEKLKKYLNNELNITPFTPKELEALFEPNSQLAKIAIEPDSDIFSKIPKKDQEDQEKYSIAKLQAIYAHEGGGRWTRRKIFDSDSTIETVETKLQALPREDNAAMKTLNVLYSLPIVKYVSSKHTHDNPKKIAVAITEKNEMHLWVYRDENNNIRFKTTHNNQSGFLSYSQNESLTAPTNSPLGSFAWNAFFQKTLWKQLLSLEGNNLPIPITTSTTYNPVKQRKLLERAFSSQQRRQPVAGDEAESGAPDRVSSQKRAIKRPIINEDGTSVIGQKTNIMNRAKELAADPDQTRRKRVCIINPMNERSVGGGVFAGAYNLEESFCRMFPSFAYSLLAHAMETPGFKDATTSHNIRDKRPEYGSHGSGPWGCYTQAVQVTQTMQQVGKHWGQHTYEPCNPPFEVDVVGNASIYIPLPRNWTNLNPTQQANYKKQKTQENEVNIRNAIRAHLHAAAMQQLRANVLLLTDFGCGGFNNDPALVAKWYAEEIVRGDYDQLFQIEFCIIDPKNRDVFKEGFDSQYNISSQARSNPLGTANAMSDHSPQVDATARAVSQNIQGPYAIKKAGNVWIFDIPQEYNSEGHPTPDELVSLTGMSHADCSELLGKMTPSNDDDNDNDNDDDPVSFLRSERFDDLGVGDALGEGGFRICIETHQKYRERIASQIDCLIRCVDNGADVLSIQEQPYAFAPGKDGTLCNDAERLKLFKQIMEERGYVQIANLLNRDTGIWVKREIQTQFQAITDQQFTTFPTEPDNNRNSIRACTAVNTETKTLYINAHMDRVKLPQGQDVAAAAAEHLRLLVALYDKAVEYAAKNDLDRIVIQGDFNLFRLSEDSVPQFESAGYKLTPVKGQEPFPKKNYEAVIEISDSQTQKINQKREALNQAQQAQPGISP